MLNPHIIWSAILDSEYVVSVQHIEAFSGILKIIHKDHPDDVVHSQDVTISYDAIWGPDIADVMQWEEIAANYVDRKLL